MREIFKRNAANMRRLVNYTEGILKGLADVPQMKKWWRICQGQGKTEHMGLSIWPGRPNWDPQFH